MMTVLAEFTFHVDENGKPVEENFVNGNRYYEPTPEEIRQGCLQAQAAWSEREFRMRSNGNEASEDVGIEVTKTYFSNRDLLQRAAE